MIINLGGPPGRISSLDPVFTSIRGFPDDNLVGLYLFDTGAGELPAIDQILTAGATVTDSSGLGNHGRVLPGTGPDARYSPTGLIVGDGGANTGMAIRTPIAFGGAFTIVFGARPTVLPGVGATAVPSFIQSSAATGAALTTPSTNNETPGLTANQSVNHNGTYQAGVFAGAAWPQISPGAPNGFPVWSTFAYSYDPTAHRLRMASGGAVSDTTDALYGTAVAAASPGVIDFGLMDFAGDAASAQGNLGFVAIYTGLTADAAGLQRLLTAGRACLVSKGVTGAV